MNHFKQKSKKLEKLRGIFFQIGLIIAGGLTLVAFEWTMPVHISTLGGEIIEEIEWDLDYVEPFEIEKEEVKEEKEEEKPKSKEFEIDKEEPIEEVIKPKEEIKKKQETNFKEGEWKEVEVIKEEGHSRIPVFKKILIM